jgi:hypothetical protein
MAWAQRHDHRKDNRFLSFEKDNHGDDRLDGASQKKKKKKNQSQENIFPSMKSTKITEEMDHRSQFSNAHYVTTANSGLLYSNHFIHKPCVVDFIHKSFVVDLPFGPHEVVYLAGQSR